MKEVHAAVKEGYMCDPPCPVICKRPEHLQNHKNTDLCVAGKFDKVCKDCKKVVVGSMDTHTKRYNCSSKYPCNECSQSFAKKDQYNDHKRRFHSTEYVIVVEDVSL